MKNMIFREWMFHIYVSLPKGYTITTRGVKLMLQAHGEKIQSSRICYIPCISMDVFDREYVSIYIYV